MSKHKVNEVAAKLAGEDTLRCPNCGDKVVGHPDDACVLNTFIGVLRDRGTPERQLRELHAECDVDALWDDVQSIINRLGKGGYTA